MISATLLTDLAEVVNGKIAKVVLNDAVELTDFSVKRVDGSTVAMQYIIPASSVSLVTNIKLKSSADETLTDNNVHVPITSDTLLLHTLPIKEV
ncbi:ketopantoate hydroxymethyltransferase [Paenibacillus sp. LX16]|uniref:ketopantoate hydroxymethyltransferase n=1 Tax=Paenibacillus sp. LX16 TaxID=1740264 RepID=UPI002E2C66F7|nr:ketopantoate hydroxymethyltransferase [Paenibacillus sp. LX16]